MREAQYCVCQSGQVETKQGDKHMSVQISPAIGSIGATSGACVGDGLVGDGGSAMRLSMRERKPTERQMSDGRS